METVEPVEFWGMPKIARLSRECIITEKIDGTNAQVYIGEDGTFLVGSRHRWITPEKDNYGFAAWAYEHKDELVAGLGPGRHFGEWWGQGIQRKYGLSERRWSLFNTERWGETRPACCHVVPIVSHGIFSTETITLAMNHLQVFGSHAAPGFMNPEGIVIYHTAANVCFKKTFEHDEEGKGNT